MKTNSLKLNATRHALSSPWDRMCAVHGPTSRSSGSRRRTPRKIALAWAVGSLPPPCGLSPPVARHGQNQPVVPHGERLERSQSFISPICQKRTDPRCPGSSERDVADCEPRTGKASDDGWRDRQDRISRRGNAANAPAFPPQNPGKAVQRGGYRVCRRFAKAVPKRFSVHASAAKPGVKEIFPDPLQGFWVTLAALL